MDTDRSISTLFSAFSVPHVLEEIFSNLDYGAIKRCREVCKEWNRYISSGLFVTSPKWLKRKEARHNLLHAKPTLTDFENYKEINVKNPLSYITDSSALGEIWLVNGGKTYKFSDTQVAAESPASREEAAADLHACCHLHVPETAPYVAWLAAPGGNVIRIYDRETLRQERRVKLDFDLLSEVAHRGDRMFVAGRERDRRGGELPEEETRSLVYMVDENATLTTLAELRPNASVLSMAVADRDTLLLLVNLNFSRQLCVYKISKRTMSRHELSELAGNRYACQDRIYLGDDWFALMERDTEMLSATVYTAWSDEGRLEESHRVLTDDLMTGNAKDVHAASQYLVMLQTHKCGGGGGGSAGQRRRRFGGVKFHHVGRRESGYIEMNFSSSSRWGSASVPAMEVVHGCVLIVAMTFELEVKIVDLESGVMRSFSNVYMRLITNTRRTGESGLANLSFFGGDALVLKCGRPKTKAKLALMTFDGRGDYSVEAAQMRGGGKAEKISIALEEEG